MGYFIVYVKPAAQCDSAEHKDIKPLLKLSKRAPLGDDFIHGEGWDKFQALMNKHGYEIHPEIGDYKPQEWPLTAVAYTSMNNRGEGRSGSSLFRLPCRLLPGYGGGSLVIPVETKS